MLAVSVNSILRCQPADSEMDGPLPAFHFSLPGSQTAPSLNRKLQYLFKVRGREGKGNEGEGREGGLERGRDSTSEKEQGNDLGSNEDWKEDN